ncbi:hypothetical protein PGTDC60_1735 [Porphyromonas gingivalis TDC60]|nr:hypothetical protein CS544_09610 [Porphyromonas gingivalis]PDP57693.1 hypothetical protein CLI74_00725 [Porphyromonas gingivalis]BAK25884.1 hypothetical protein PGTDC60_1735 [Porphyromonas gingivalis TDC60]
MSLRSIYKSFTIYIFIENDLYIKQKRFIYKLKMFYIQIVASLVLSGISICKSSFSLHFYLAFLLSTDTYLESFQTRLRC